MASREAAKGIVSSIAKKYGYVAQSVWDKLEKHDPEMRKNLEESMRNTQGIAAQTITTLATQVYGSDARFVFELLQNADDNRFQRARDDGDVPFVEFHVYSNRIVVECNEDGFTEADLSAICSVGKSTKSVSYGYIGAKGIGFKSVFIAAWRVFVQSGHFAFSFEHRREDENLGMVIPIWQDTQEQLPVPLTRMTLYFHETGDPAELDHLRHTIFQQLGDLDHTCLLFLRNIKQLRVTFRNDKDEVNTSKDFRAGHTNGQRIALDTTTTSADGTSATNTQHYHLTRHMANGLSSSANRTVPGTDKARAGSSQAEVVLAFPLTANSAPLLKPQEVFAFLPIRRSDYKFIIQSDFDLSANRQDIAVTSRRNLDLLEPIAKAFVNAVLQLCQHPTLRFTWPQFLPDLDEPNEFWSGLNKQIRFFLSRTPVLRSRHGPRLRKLDDVVTLSGDFMDGSNSPLINDDELDPFISGHYPKHSSSALKRYGLGNNNFPLVLKLLQRDLDDPNSRVKSYKDEKWHSALAQILLKVEPSRLQCLELLPLMGGKWVSARTCSIPLLPTTNGILVPEGLPMPILDPSATSNTDRLALYARLGAVEPSVPAVRACILGHYGLFSQKVGLETSRSHLHFLYRSHQSNNTRDELRSISVWGSDQDLIRVHYTDVFLRGDQRYGPQALLGATSRSPGLQVDFLHPTYLEDEPFPPTRTHPSWVRWLHDFVGVQERLSLMSRKGDSLSATWKFVAEHRPEDLLGLLKHLWVHQCSDVSKRPDLVAAIRDTSAKNLCSPRLSLPCSLQQTYLPLTTLRQECRRFLDESEEFPFLDLEGFSSSLESITDWMFLASSFFVGKDQNLAFFLDILARMKDLDCKAFHARRNQQVLDLYATMGPYASKTPGGNERVRCYFESNQCVLIPAHGGHEAKWAKLKDCLWEAPQMMKTKHTLKYLYHRVLRAEQIHLLAHFFQKNVTVENASWKHLVDELRHARDNGSEDFDDTLSLYSCLNKMKTLECVADMRQVFAAEGLIYVDLRGRKGWYKSGDCLWSSTAEIRGKVTLNDHYGELKALFVKTLGVQTLTLRMVHNELLQVKPHSSIAELKTTIRSFSALLQTEKDTLDPELLLKAKVFPVRFPDGNIALSSATTDFAIGDREYLVARFQGKIRMLDYTVEEAWQLKPFFEWAKLTTRLLSVAVQESSTFSPGVQQPIGVPKRDLKRKAYAFLRIAATFNSLRYQQDPDGLYQLLRSTRTIETDGIRSVSKIFEDSRWIEVDEIVGNQYISEDAQGLTIYVPVDDEAQDFCFCSALAQELAGWLTKDPLTNDEEDVHGDMVRVLGFVLVAELLAVDRILNHRGIIQISVPYENSSITAEVATGQSSTLGSANEQQLTQASISPRRLFSNYSDPSEGPPKTPTLRAKSTSPMMPSPEQTLFRSNRVARQTLVVAPASSTTVALEDAGYRRLLDRVLQSARTGAFPATDAFDTTGLMMALPREGDRSDCDLTATGNALRSLDRLERDKRVGAAGELYVFELLSRLDPPLSGWCRENWQSTIRHYAAVHQDYGNMEPWLGRETADITYDDTEGDLTAMLIEHGYLERDGWQTARPKYYIEVKATTGSLKAPFYMSKSQYKRMKDIHDAGDCSEVYILLRVYEIDGAGIAMKVYLDPEQMRLDETLFFTGETWSVVPS